MASMGKCSLAQSEVICLCLLCFPIQYFQNSLCFDIPLWLGTENREKKSHNKAAEVHQYQKMIVEPWVWLCACESRGRTETHPHWGSKGLAAILLLHPGDWLWMRGKHTDLKGRMLAEDRGWSKIEEVLPRTKGCLLAPPSWGLMNILLYLFSLCFSQPLPYLMVPMSAFCSRV